MGESKVFSRALEQGGDKSGGSGYRMLPFLVLANGPGRRELPAKCRVLGQGSHPIPRSGAKALKLFGIARTRRQANLRISISGLAQGARMRQCLRTKICGPGELAIAGLGPAGTYCRISELYPAGRAAKSCFERVRESNDGEKGS